MEINHTIVPAKGKLEAAKFFAEIMGLEVGEIGHFAPVHINDHFSMDFADADDVDLWKPMNGKFARQHYAFVVSEEEFDDIFGRIQAKGMKYGSDPGPKLYNMEINHRKGGRGVYWDDLNGHSMELMTRA
jgi:catechol 2,3-dioxygenase-like lactoylglutathione lyase family enzyme